MFSGVPYRPPGWKCPDFHPIEIIVQVNGTKIRFRQDPENENDTGATDKLADWILALWKIEANTNQ